MNGEKQAQPNHYQAGAQNHGRHTGANNQCCWHNNNNNNNNPWQQWSGQDQWGCNSSTWWQKKMRAYFISLIFGTALGVMLGVGAIMLIKHMWCNHHSQCKYGVLVPMQNP